ncbi:MAG: hypothetical protein HYR72_10310 [Deltaproteobacteria bacterium]|nr:hypothetical protein [Deltaproteobacteria bacterium]MBI3388093.1 hypothetical protein [Deltaproteobacteria bacterium]
MRNLVLLLLVVIALIAWTRWRHSPIQETHSPSGGPVRQVEREPSDMMARENALPPPGGIGPKAMFDSVGQGLQGLKKPDER